MLPPPSADRPAHPRRARTLAALLLLGAGTACTSADQAAPVAETVTVTVQATAAPSGAPSAPTSAVPSAPTATTPSVAPPPTRAQAAAPTPTAPCARLRSRGYDYVRAVEYFTENGRPAAMDEDRNGVPCETVYSAAEVSAYYSGSAYAGHDLPAGLLCRDLAARGLPFATAADYWFSEGGPARMDADGNGIPCETVYSRAEIQAYGG